MDPRNLSSEPCKTSPVDIVLLHNLFDIKRVKTWSFIFQHKSLKVRFRVISCIKWQRIVVKWGAFKKRKIPKCNLALASSHLPRRYLIVIHSSKFNKLSRPSAKIFLMVNENLLKTSALKSKKGLCDGGYRTEYPGLKRDALARCTMETENSFYIWSASSQSTGAIFEKTAEIRSS